MQLESRSRLRHLVRPRRRRRPSAACWPSLTAALLLLVGADAAAQTSSCFSNFSIHKTLVEESNPRGVNCGSGLYRCYPVEELGRAIRLTDPACDPALETCDVELAVTLRYPGNAQTVDALGAGSAPKAVAWWYAGADPPACDPTSQPSCSQQAVAACGAPFLDTQIVEDRVTTFLRIQASCQQLEDGVVHPQMGSYSLLAYACSTAPAGCRLRKEVSGLQFTAEAIAAALDCPQERKEECRECLANVDGGMGKVPAGGDAACVIPADSGPGATLRYTGRGAGGEGLAGTAEWAPTLGRNWSHDYAPRIVPDPDDSHVWLITRWATFREFSNLVGGVYSTVSPSDEYRTLERTGIGWTLTDLDGTVTEFDAGGLWLSTTDRNGNAKTGTYSAGQLVSVSFPDGRSEAFTYHPGGKLASITEVATDGLATRTWSYTWSGDDLARIDRPDGTAWAMTYDDPAHPGYMTLLELEGSDGTSQRVEQGWEYDAQGNVVRTWRGAATFTDPAAVDKWELAFDDPVEPTETTVTDPLGQTIVYTIGRDSVSDKPRVDAVSGGCPGCGLESDTTFVYGGTHPLLPIQQTDAEGQTTSFTYTTEGQVESRTEAFGTGLARTTTFTYDPTYPALVTEIEQPSTAGGGNFRHTTIIRNATGDPESRTITGIEAASPFSLTTVTVFNTAGQPLSIDPPGYATADQMTFSYDSTGLILVSRTEPLVGTTTFGHDAFNRRESLTDPNGVETTTAYDALDRVREVRQLGAMPADDLVTTHAYDPFGDLAITILPEGNQILYDYDAAGRLTSIERRSADGSQRERTVYTLDGAGNRITEELQSWNGSAWGVKSTTDFEYVSRCHLGRVIHPDSTATRYDYTCNGNLEAVWDANHPFVNEVSTPPTERYVYDALDRLIEVRQPWPAGGEAVTSYGYDVQDHLTAVTDAEGNTTTYAYSDRDLLTQEVSPASGTTTNAYNEHGELVSTTDARGITSTRTVDEADRVAFVDYPGGTDLDVAYTYGTNPAVFEVSRLTGITRNGQTIAYAYDRFGRVTEDGELTYAYDRNGNRTTIGYPGGVEASTTFDFADRDATLSVESPAGVTPVVTSSAYLPSGPLTSLALGNGATETRTFTTRYFPASVALDAARDRSYAYTTDAVGNITSITETVECLADVLLENRTVTGVEVHQSCDEVTAGPAVEVAPGGSLTLRGANRVVLRDGFSVASGASFTAGTDPDLDGGTWTYTYQDPQYFLTSATGPWGDLAWSYDRIGNRLTETRDGATDTYLYTLNGTGGNTPLLDEIQLAVLGTRSFTYGPAGHLEAVDSAGSLVDFTYDEAGRMELAERAGSSTPFAYDGRSYLTQAGEEPGLLGATHPTYSSEGLLHTLTQRVTATDSGKTHHVFHFAGRPVAQITIDEGVETWRYLTTDHLGTPLVATDAVGAELWAGPFEPFGRDRLASTNLAALAEDVFLRLPGQWADEVWQEATRGTDAYYNMHRWYRTGEAAYTRADPLGLPGPEDWDDNYLNVYAYAAGNPLTFADPTGLITLLPENDISRRCRRRWLRKILPRLHKVTDSPECRDFFCQELTTDLDSLLNGVLPLIVSPRGLGGGHRCHRNLPANLSPTITIEPFTITVRKSSLCGSTRDALHVIVHELGHFADCFNNGDRFDDEHDGCGAEIACFGSSIGDNCSGFAQE